MQTRCSFQVSGNPGGGEHPGDPVVPTQVLVFKVGPRFRDLPENTLKRLLLKHDGIAGWSN